jgi:RNA polymerase sigma-70 factor (ECF subfamily)
MADMLSVMRVIVPAVAADNRPSGLEVDAEAKFIALVERNSRPILAFALRRTDRPEDAADVVSDVMLVAWRRMTDVPAGNEELLWLYGVARRVLANQHRAKRRRNRLGERLRQVVGHAITEDLAEAHARSADIRSALATLSETDREVLILQAWEGLDTREIATVLEIDPVTVRTRAHRARERLRRALDERSSDG